jgi:hypothetical protein
MEKLKIYDDMSVVRAGKRVYYYTFHARTHEDENEVRNLCFYDFVCLCAEFSSYSS